MSAGFILAATITLVGCGEQPVGVAEVKPGQVEAASLAWSELGRQRTGRAQPIPEILWVQGAALACGGWGWMNHGQCVNGLNFGDVVSLAWPEGNAVFSDDDKAPLVHEFEHSMLEDAEGDEDADHSDPAWGEGGAVEQVNARLQEAGR